MEKTQDIMKPQQSPEDLTNSDEEEKQEHLETEMENMCNSQEETESEEESNDFKPDDLSAMEFLLQYIPLEEIHFHAREIGIDPDTELHLIWLVKECFSAPLPPDWEECEDSSFKIFYKNISTGDITLDCPTETLYRQLVIQERALHKATAEGIETNTEDDTKKESQEPLKSPETEDLTSSDEEVEEEEEEEDLETEENMYNIQEETESEEESIDDLSAMEFLLQYIPLEEIHFHARELGIDPDTELHLIWLIKECFSAPLPPDWEECEDSSGDTFYKNISTGDITLDCPTETLYRQLVIQERALHKATAEGIETNTEDDTKKESQEPLKSPETEDLTSSDEEVEEEEEEEDLETEENMYNIQEETESEEESTDDLSAMEFLLQYIPLEEIHFHARELGIDPDTELHLIWLIKECFSAPLPPDWEECEDSSGDTFYKNISTGDITLDCPTETLYRQLVIQERALHKATAEGIETNTEDDTKKESQEPLKSPESEDLTSSDEEVEEEEEDLETEENMCNSQEETESEEESTDDLSAMEFLFKYCTEEGTETNREYEVEEEEDVETEKENDMYTIPKELRREEADSNLNEESEKRLRALQQHLLSKRNEEEARLNEESDRIQKELIESVQQENERKQLQLREDSKVFLKEQRMTTEKEEAAERHKLEAQKKQNIERLRADMEEELQAERKKLQGYLEEKLGSLKQELTNSHQEMKEEMQRDHKMKMKQLREDHEREMHSIRQQCLDEAEVLRKNLITSLQDDRKHLQDSYAAQLEKLLLELNAQVEKAQKIQSQKVSELQDLADQIELKAKDLKIQETMLQTKVSDLERKKKKLQEKELHMHEKTDVSARECLCEAVSQLLLKQTDEATVVERRGEEKHKAVEENKGLKGEVKRLKTEREEALEESRRAKMDNKVLENKVLLLEERSDLLSQTISVMEHNNILNASPRPQPEQDINKVPSCYKRNSPLHVEDLFRPPLSPEPQSLSSPDRLRCCICSHGPSSQQRDVLPDRKSHQLLERQETLQEAQSSSSQSSNQEEEVTLQALQQLQDVSQAESELSSSVEPPDMTGPPDFPEDHNHLEAFLYELSDQVDTMISALTVIQDKHRRRFNQPINTSHV